MPTCMPKVLADHPYILTVNPENKLQSGCILSNWSTENIDLLSIFMLYRQNIEEEGKSPSQLNLLWVHMKRWLLGHKPAQENWKRDVKINSNVKMALKKDRRDAAELELELGRNVLLQQLKSTQHLLWSVTYAYNSHLCVVCNIFFLSSLSLLYSINTWKPGTKEEKKKSAWRNWILLLRLLYFPYFWFLDLTLMHLSSAVNSSSKRRKLFHPGREDSFRHLCCWAERKKGQFLFISITLEV